MSVTAPFNRRAIQDALIAWVESATGLAGSVIWSDQGAPAPAFPYATCKILSISGAGHDDEAIDPTPTAPVVAGAEVALETRGLRELVLSCNVHSIAPDGDHADDPEDDAHALMDKLCASVFMDTYASPLRDAGVSFLRKTPTQNLDALNTDVFRARAQTDFVFSLASNVEERVTYIETAEVSSNLFPGIVTLSVLPEP